VLNNCSFELRQEGRRRVGGNSPNLWGAGNRRLLRGEVCAAWWTVPLRRGSDSVTV